MNKILVIGASVAMSLLMASAHAEREVDVLIDRDQKTGYQMNEVDIGAWKETKYGTFDSWIMVRQVLERTSRNGLGFELGYSQYTSFGPVNAYARVAYGWLNLTEGTRHCCEGSTEYISTFGELTVPNKTGFTPFVNWTHRFGLDPSTTLHSTNRYFVGVETPAVAGVRFRAAATHLVFNGDKYEGVNITALYSF